MHITFLEKLPGKYESEIYETIAMNDLIVFALYTIQDLKSEVTAEDIVVAAFTMFPKRFSLRGYPNWPDSGVVNKRWVDCRNKGLMTGTNASGFSITPKGIDLASRVHLILQGKRKGIPQLRKKIGVQTEARTRAGKFVRSVEKNVAFRRYAQVGREAEISEYDFRNVLLCTMETSPEVLVRNLEHLRQYVGMYNREDILEFLDLCAEKNAPLLSTAKQAGPGLLGSRKRKQSGGKK